MKCCASCGLMKPESEFRFRNKTAAVPKRRSYCKSCGNRSATRWHKANPERVARWRAAVARGVRKWNSRNKERVVVSQKASGQVSRAIKKGLLTRPLVCEQCGRTGVIQAAHSDYTRPLDVRWLCVSCHVTWDRAYPKTLAALNTAAES